jgi:hypothetical protein
LNNQDKYKPIKSANVEYIIMEKIDGVINIVNKIGTQDEANEAKITTKITLETTCPGLKDIRERIESLKNKHKDKN